jgi:hypothetical protein
VQMNSHKDIDVKKLIAENYRLRKQLAQERKSCTWTRRRDKDLEDTECGMSFYFYENGGADENHFNFCPYCGRVIEETYEKMSPLERSLQDYKGD